MATVAASLANDVTVTHGGHWACGIFGMRFLHRALTASGYGATAVSNLLVEGYPGFQDWFNNPVEPSTTMNELPDYYAEGPGMNSRNHIMFGGVGPFLYDLVGIRQAPTSTGWANAWLWPVVTGHAALPYASGWKSALSGQFTVSWRNVTGNVCLSDVPENTNVTLSCPGDTSNTIVAVAFASFGTPTGSCGGGGGFAVNASCNAANTSAIIAGLCVGQHSCTVPSSDQVYGDPCYDVVKHLDVQVVCASAAFTIEATVPVNARATVVLPLGGGSASSVTVTEGAGNTVVFTGGAYVPGTPGVTSAYPLASGTAVGVDVGSGSYVFSAAL